MKKDSRKENNPKLLELNQLKKNARRQNLTYDTEKADAAREANRKRKAKYRGKQKSLNQNKENEQQTDSDGASGRKSRRSGDLSDVTLASDDEDRNENNASDENNCSFKTQKN